MRQDYLPPEVGWREALRLAGLDPGDLRGIGLRRCMWITVVIVVGFAAAWLLY